MVYVVKFYLFDSPKSKSNYGSDSRSRALNLSGPELRTETESGRSQRSRHFTPITSLVKRL